MPTQTTSGITLYLSRDEDLLHNGRNRDRLFARVRRGVYVEAKQWAKLAPWERYRVRVEAVAMTWTAPIFCLESAAAPLGLPIFGEPSDVHLLDPGGKSRRFGDIVIHACTEEVATATQSGTTTTSLTETALDLCRVLPPAFALATADSAIRMLASDGLTFDVGALGREHANRRGRRQLDWVGRRATGVAESTGESVSRAVIEWLGFDAPELQTWFAHENAADRADFYWRHQRVIGESDGYGKYDASDSERSKAQFIAEKVREDRLRRYESGFARWDWGDTMRATPVGDKLSRAGLQPTRPRQQALLATLRTNPRSLPPVPKKVVGDRSRTRETRSTV